MKRTLFLLLILFFVRANAQYSEGIVYFKNGDTTKGLIKKKPRSIKFKTERKSKPIQLNHEKINGFQNQNGEFCYKYPNGLNSSKVLGFDSSSGKMIFEKSKNEPTTPILLKVILKGAINLYAVEISSPMGLPSSGGGITFVGGSSTIYYIEKRTNFIEIGSKIKKSHLSYFNDCPILLEKIKDKTIRKNDPYSVIYFYNIECVAN